jgi:hypothetical protein
MTTLIRRGFGFDCCNVGNVTRIFQIGPRSAANCRPECRLPDQEICPLQIADNPMAKVIGISAILAMGALPAVADRAEETCPGRVAVVRYGNKSGLSTDAGSVPVGDNAGTETPGFPDDLAMGALKTQVGCRRSTHSPKAQPNVPIRSVLLSTVTMTQNPSFALPSILDNPE